MRGMENMNYSTVLKTIFITLLLSFSPINVLAEDTVDSLNAKAEEENSPYRWVTLDKKELVGDVIPGSTMKVHKPETIIGRVKAKETSVRRSKNVVLKETRALKPGGHWGQYFVEAWVFDNEGLEVVYTFWLRNPTEYLFKGPYTNNPDDKK